MYQIFSQFSNVLEGDRFMGVTPPCIENIKHCLKLYRHCILAFELWFFDDERGTGPILQFSFILQDFPSATD